MNNKMKKMVAKAKKVYGEACSNYPLTIIIELIATIIACVFVVVERNDSYLGERDTGYWVARWLRDFAIFLAAGCFSVEALPKKWYEKGKAVKKTLLIAVFAVISAFLVSVLNSCFIGFKELDNIPKWVYSNSEMWTIGYFVLITLIVIYCRYLESEKSIEKYFVSATVGLVQIFIVWSILAVGFLVLSAVFCELIFDVDSLYSIPQILIIGLYVVPNFTMILTKVKEEVGRFFEALIKYALLIITLVGALIIYMYIIKTVFFNGIPSNQIFWITSGLFFVAIPVGFACTAFEKDSVLQKIAFAIPYIYAPFIILQAYSDIVRIDEYGLTPSRYMGLVLVVLEIIYTVVYAVKRKHIDKIIIVMMALTVIVALIPGTNAVDASKASQKNVIKNFIKNGMPATQEEQKKICGAYKYLLNQAGEDYVDKLLTREQQQTISAMGTMTGEYVFRDYTKTYTLTSNNSFIPTTGYDIIAGFDTYVDNSSGEVDVSNVVITVDNSEFGPFDFTDEVERVKMLCQSEVAGYYQGEDIIKVSDDCEIVVTYFRVLSDDEINTVKELRVSGHLLFKDSYFGGNSPSTAVEVK